VHPSFISNSKVVNKEITVFALTHAQTLLEIFAAAPFERRFLTEYSPGETQPYRSYSFGEFLAKAEQFAGLYRQHEVAPRDKIVLVMRQGCELMAAFVGAMIAGAVPTILAYPNFKVNPEKYKTGLLGVTRNIHATLVVVDEQFPEQLRSHIATTSGTTLINFRSNTTEVSKPSISWFEPTPDDVAFIQHSAGTTGLQKGVALSHRAILNQLGHLADGLRIQNEDRIVSWLPLYHDMGQIACFMLPLACHIPVVMQSPTDWVLDPLSMLHLATKYRCTLCWVPNFAFQFMARRAVSAELSGIDLSSLRAMINCSEPVRADSMNEFLNAFQRAGLVKSVLQTSYAMAENTFAVTQSQLDGGASPTTIWAERKPFLTEGEVRKTDGATLNAIAIVSCGKCLPGNSVRVLDRDQNPLPDGKTGELVIHSDSLFDGYYNRPDLTEKSFIEKWYRTGDIGFCYEGEVFVIGRRDDTIIIAGRNIYPQDVEEIVYSHINVHDGRAVAFGLWNDDLGTHQLVVVAEVNSEKDLEKSREIESEIRSAIAKDLDIGPKFVRLVPPQWIIKSTAGKPARSSNKQKFLAEFSDGHDS